KGNSFMDKKVGMPTTPETSRRDSKALRERIVQWAQMQEADRLPPTVSAFARELGVTRSYVQKVIKQTKPQVARQPDQRSDRERIKDKLADLAIKKGDTAAAKLWLRMEREDRTCGQKQTSPQIDEEE